MSEKENDIENLAIDPPDNQGGGNAAAASLESSRTSEDAAPIDPPDNQSGGSAG